MFLLRCLQRPLCIQQPCRPHVLIISDHLFGSALQKIEAPVRGNEASDGGPPMSDRLGGNDRLFIQEDGAKEKNLLGTGVHYCYYLLLLPPSAADVYAPSTDHSLSG